MKDYHHVNYCTKKYFYFQYIKTFSWLHVFFSDKEQWTVYFTLLAPYANVSFFFLNSFFDPKIWKYRDFIFSILNYVLNFLSFWGKKCQMVYIKSWKKITMLYIFTLTFFFSFLHKNIWLPNINKYCSSFENWLFMPYNIPTHTF
jgi:hypothetical protein